MTERRPPWPADKPPKERGLFQLYEKFAILADVRLAFEHKYGYAPAHIHYTGGGWLAGPIREGER